MPGRHFGFLAVLSASWVAARVGILTVVNSSAAQSPLPLVSDRVRATPFVGVTAIADSPVAHGKACCASALAADVRADRLGRIGPAVATRPLMEGAPVDAALSPSNGGAEIWVGGLPDAAAHTTPADRKRLRVYAYSFWRDASPGAGLTSGDQYGSGQSGFIATYDIAHFVRAGHAPKLALMGRRAVAHDDLRERELAAGLRWWPLPGAGISLTAERRFRHGRADAFAAYAAGGKSDIPLPLEFRLDGYAQAGFVSGSGGGPFFDAAARAERRLATIGRLPVAGGVGIWAGGQSDVVRADIGPAVRANLQIGKTAVRLDADWRFRVAGNARPANGPALTLSTAF